MRVTVPAKRKYSPNTSKTLCSILLNTVLIVWRSVLDDSEYKIGKGVVGIVVHGEKDNDVAGAKLTIVHKNLENGEPAPGPLTISDKENGLYIISGLNLQRDGRWELFVNVRKGDVEDSVKFIFPDVLKERHPEGAYSP